jgi:AraC-like DNA-binding protein
MASQMRFETGRAPDALFLRFEILLARLPPHIQAVERALLLTQQVALNISQGKVRAREIWFAHEPLSPLSTYREYFGGVPVRFNQRLSGLFFADSDLDREIPNIDPQLYEITTEFIESRFPSINAALSTRVRTIVERSLLKGDCTYSGVASTLAMHPRTLQRRLRAENESFESIKDSVRRDIALHYLKRSSLPLIRIAKMLGYSETSALSRSCYRWFSASPRQLRAGTPTGRPSERRTLQTA